MTEFKFNIGDIVTHKAAVAEAQMYAEAGAHRVVNAGMIVERMMQECHGGVQRLYRLSNADRLAAEIELMLLSDYDAAAVAVAAVRADRRQMGLKYGPVK